MENASHNLANANTVGFKQDLLTMMERPTESRTWLNAEELNRIGYIDKLNDRMGGGVWLHKSHAALEQGNPINDDNPLHFAIEGPGFFAMKDVHSGEVFYSRAGNFDINSEGILQSADGLYHVLDDKGSEININDILGESPVGVLAVNSLGELQVSTESGTDATGRALGITVFSGDDAFKLQKFGNTMFVAYGPELVADANQLTELAGRESVETQVHQGSLEGSGIDVVKAMVNQVEIARSYERQMNMISMQNGTVETLVSRVGRAI